MTTPSERAEAILIVIKRVLKWILISVFVVAVLGISIISFLDYQSSRDYKKRKEQEDKVEIVANYGKSDCEAGYPYFYGVVNNSDKEIKNVRFSVEIRKKGFSSALNSYTSIDEDKILKPGEGYGRCFRATKKDYSGELKEKDVDIVVTYKDVTYTNKD